MGGFDGVNVTVPHKASVIPLLSVANFTQNNIVEQIIECNQAIFDMMKNKLKSITLTCKIAAGEHKTLKRSLDVLRNEILDQDTVNEPDAYKKWLKRQRKENVQINKTDNIQKQLIFYNESSSIMLQQQQALNQDI